MSRAAAQRGFTLIEVLVALTLMALVSLISWRGLDAVQRTGERLDDRAEEALALVRALGQIERDLLLHADADILSQQAGAPPANTPGSTTDAAARMPAGIVWNPQTGLDLVRSAGDGLWQRIRWYLDDGSLIRAAGAPSYLLPLPEPEAAVVVLEQVEGLGLRAWLPGQGWVQPAGVAPEQPQATDEGGPADNVAGRGPLATGLEVALHRKGQASDQPYRKVVALP